MAWAQESLCASEDWAPSASSLFPHPPFHRRPVLEKFRELRNKWKVLQSPSLPTPPFLPNLQITKTLLMDPDPRYKKDDVQFLNLQVGLSYLVLGCHSFAFIICGNLEAVPSPIQIFRERPCWFTLIIL